VQCVRETTQQVFETYGQILPQARPHSLTHVLPPAKMLAPARSRQNGGKMKKIQRKPRHGNLYRYESAYSLELARGASHIASMLSAATQEAAVQEVMQEFVAARGTAGLDAFCWLLAERLEKRGCAAAATKARDFDTSCLTQELVVEDSAGWVARRPLDFVVRRQS
jgi:hypothetical protein